jgi:type II secretory pathway predicted ATPase ExeA
MYEGFFGFRERPFDLTPSPRYLVLTDSHREALRNLEYGIGSRKGVTLLVGEAGSGKTTIIRAAMEMQPTRVHCVHLNNPTLSRDEFVEMLALKFGLSKRASRSKTTLLTELEELGSDRLARGETTVLIVDEAQSLPLEILEEIRLLANIETNEDKLLTVVIAGQPEIAQRLNAVELRQLKQRVALRCELKPLTSLETETYIAGRIRAAGGSGAEVFTSEAIRQIHDSARGLPRTVNVIADNALLGGLAAGLNPVTLAIVQDVCADFDLARHTPVMRQPVFASSPTPVSWPTEPVLPPPVAAPAGPALVANTQQAHPEPDEREEEPRQPTEVFNVFQKRKRFSFFGN